LVPPPLPMDFMLKASDESEFRLSQHRGKVVLLSFGYTFCPDVCPTTLAELSQVRTRLGESVCRRKPFGKNVEGLSVFRTSTHAVPDTVRLDDYQQPGFFVGGLPQV
jgi:peroxiredoxin